MKKLVNVFGVIVFCLVIISYFFNKKYEENLLVNITNNNLNTEFYGKIDSLYIDYQNHGWLTIILSTKKTLRFNGSDKYLYKKDDSLVKRKGEDSIYIYRDEIIKSYKF